MKRHDAPPPGSPRRPDRSESEAAIRSRPGRVPSPEQAPSVTAEKPGVAAILNGLLADEFLLYVKTLNFHWNVRGMQFHSLHPFLEKIYEEQFRAVDDIAERVRTVGGLSLGSMEEFLKSARLQEAQGFPPDPRAMFSALLQDLDSILISLRMSIGEMDGTYDDPGTGNFLAQAFSSGRRRWRG